MPANAKNDAGRMPLYWNGVSRLIDCAWWLKPKAVTTGWLARARTRAALSELPECTLPRDALQAPVIDLPVIGLANEHSEQYSDPVVTQRI